MLIRVFELPKVFTKDFLFQNTVNHMIREVDWFQYHDKEEPWNDFYQQLSEFIKSKIYYNPDKVYLIMSTKYSFTLNYKEEKE